jgi:hypothetical protein
MTARLNARVPDEVARKVKYLRTRLTRSTTDVVIASIEALYAQVAKQEEPARLLEDLVGCAEGPGDLSSTYKSLYADSLATKYEFAEGQHRAGKSGPNPGRHGAPPSISHDPDGYRFLVGID